MEVICINKNGWHAFNGNVYAFAEPRTGLNGYPIYGKECIVTGLMVDIYGDLLYKIKGYGDIGLDAEAFAFPQGKKVELYCETRLRSVP